MPHTFKAELAIIGINPFVFVPEKILEAIFKQAGKDKGPVAVKGTVNKLPYKQTLVKYAGDWRLYINLKMLKHSPKRIGEIIHISIEHDTEKRMLPFHPGLKIALDKNKKAKKVFDALPSYHQNEINRYILNLKSAESVKKNITRAVDYLLGKGSFTGRKPLVEK